jgi:hypothetical protein
LEVVNITWSSARSVGIELFAPTVVPGLKFCSPPLAMLTLSRAENIAHTAMYTYKGGEQNFSRGTTIILRCGGNKYRLHRAHKCWFTSYLELRQWSPKIKTSKVRARVTVAKAGNRLRMLVSLTAGLIKNKLCPSFVIILRKQKFSALVPKFVPPQQLLPLQPLQLTLLQSVSASVLELWIDRVVLCFLCYVGVCTLPFGRMHWWIRRCNIHEFAALIELTNPCYRFALYLTKMPWPPKLPWHTIQELLIPQRVELTEVMIVEDCVNAWLLVPRGSDIHVNTESPLAGSRPTWIW